MARANRVQRKGSNSKKRTTAIKNKRKELSRTIQAYNKRVKRAREKYGESYSLSPVTIKDVARDFKTVADYNRAIKRYEKARGNYIVPNKSGITKFEKYLNRLEKQREKRQQDREKEKRNKEILKMIEVEPSGKFPTESEMIKKEIGFESMSEDNIEKFNVWMNENYNKTVLWKNNYLKAIENSLEIAMDLGNIEAVESLEELYKLISGMDLDRFLIGQLTEPAEIAIDYVYMGKGGDWSERIDRIIRKWDDI